MGLVDEDMVRGKGHWGYSRVFLDDCPDELTLHPTSVTGTPHPCGDATSCQMSDSASTSTVRECAAPLTRNARATVLEACEGDFYLDGQTVYTYTP